MQAYDAARLIRRRPGADTVKSEQRASRFKTCRCCSTRVRTYPCFLAHMWPELASPDAKEYELEAFDGTRSTASHHS